jgi:calcium/calmodulin-dependent protein kinase (CaM kinase) II
MQMPDAIQSEILHMTQRLLHAIATQDWATYEQLCDPTLTCFEPEARGHLVEGLEFHRFYFERKGEGKAARTTISSPHVRVAGDMAIVSYNRLTQSEDAAGQPVTSATQETRVWQRYGVAWRLVHFHRSGVS